MGSKSIAHEAEGWMGYCLWKIQLVGQKYWNKTTYLEKHDSDAIVLVFKAGTFC